MLCIITVNERYDPINWKETLLTASATRVESVARKLWVDERAARRSAMLLFPDLEG